MYFYVLLLCTVCLVSAETEPVLGPPLSFDEMFDACPAVESFKPCSCNGTSKEIVCGYEIYEPNEVRYIFKDAHSSRDLNATGRHSYSHLIFENSTLERLADHSFGDFTFLGLTLRNNYYLTELAIDTFSGTANVTRAVRFDNNPHLGATNESTIKLFKVIQKFVNVENLMIHKCAVQFVPSGLFEAFPRIKRISLKYNEIKTIQSDAFSNVPTLRFIHLTGNQIDRLETNALLLHSAVCRRGYRRSDVHFYVDLDDNQLQSESFAPRAITTNCSLDLNIVNNSIIYLPEHAFRPLFEQYSQVHMHGNNIDCTNCQMDWIQKGQFCPTFNETVRFYVMLDSGCTQEDLLPIIARCSPYAQRFKKIKLQNASSMGLIDKYMEMYPKDFFEPNMALLRCPDQYLNAASSKIIMAEVIVGMLLFYAFNAFLSFG